ncbi:MAG: PEP-CTERM sorting domain-containing protein [Verrucomicrobia bacterium]|nr:PEP-CTERM sorting domain-containing protein [Verrucomicrobiota bacterium]
MANFILANRYPTIGLDAPVLDWEGRLLAGEDWRFELYGGPAVDLLAPAVNREPFGPSRVVVGLYTAGYFRDTHSMLTVATIPGEYPWAWLQVRCWSLRVGESYEAVAALGLGGYGESAIFKAAGGYFEYTIGDVPRPLAELQSFTVRQIVPEPATWALLAVGSLGLWWVRRQGKARNKSCSVVGL